MGSHWGEKIRRYLQSLYPVAYQRWKVVLISSLVVFLIGLTWVTSALAVFTKDTLSVVNLIVQVGFWATPIVWSMDMMPATVQNVLKLNPIFYICNGYREAFCTNSWFFQDHPLWTAYYWIFTLVLFVIGAYVFKRLRPQSADLL